MIGTQGFSFIDKGSNNTSAQYTHKTDFTNDILSNWESLLQRRKEKLSKDNIIYKHMVVPNKLTVYSNYYPFELESFESHPLNLLAKLPSLDSILIDLRSTFNSEKFTNLLYWKSDSHWTPWGCYIAYREICNNLQTNSIKILEQRDFGEGNLILDLGSKRKPAKYELARFYKISQLSNIIYENELVRFKKENNLLNESNLHTGSHVVRENENSLDDRSLMLFGDSFSEYRNHLLFGMLSETFRRVSFVWNASIDFGLIEKEKPDIVISQIAERFCVKCPDDKLDISVFAKTKLDLYINRKNN